MLAQDSLLGERGPELLEQVERLRRKQFEVYIDQSELERR